MATLIDMLDDCPNDFVPSVSDIAQIYAAAINGRGYHERQVVAREAIADFLLIVSNQEDLPERPRSGGK